MGNSYVKTLFAVLVFCGFIMSCALPPTDPLTPSYSAMNLDSELSSGRYQPKVGSFLVILDGSSSMNEPYKSPHKLTSAKQFLYDMYYAISDIEINGAQRSFGHDQRITETDTVLNVSMSAFKTSASPSRAGTLLI